MKFQSQTRHLTAILLVVTTASAAAEADVARVGAASCAGSQCHGAGAPSATATIRQDEFFVWQRQDAHSNAYKVLQGERGKRIAARLGLGAAHQEPACLNCHADVVPEPQRGRRYRVEDGVSCETCHGGAQRWLGSHAAGATHRENLTAGMYPMADPEARARVCLHCHLGSADKPMTHRIMAAGHPPLLFELDTFTALQPAHFTVDDDYRRRKTVSAGARTWVLGQLVAAEFSLNNLAGERFSSQGLFPELVFYDCNACHHPAGTPRWAPGVAGPLGPGSARLALVSLELTGTILEALLPAHAAQWNESVAALHAASAVSLQDTRAAAGRLLKLLPGLRTELASGAYGRGEILRLAGRLAEAGGGAAAASFSAAEQIAMAMGVLANDLATAGGLPRALKPALDALYASTADRNAYEPEKFRGAVRRLHGVLAKSA